MRRRMPHLLATTLALACANLSCGVDTQSEYQGCLTEVYRAYADAQRDWQRALRDLIVKSRPEFRELAELNSELQLLMIDQSAVRFRHLVRVEPQGLRVDEGLAGFVNVGANWSASDEANLLADRDYERLQERLDSLRSLNDGHPDWPALRSYLSSELAETSAYTRSLSVFQQRVSDLEGELAACRAE